MTTEDRRRWDAQTETLQQIREAQQGTDRKVDELVVHVKGNGGKGLQQRMDALEEWRELRPQTCPLSREEIHKRRALEMALYGVVIAVVTLAVNVIMGLWGG